MTSIHDLASKPYVTASELAHLVGVSVYTIRRAARAGKLPTLKVGGSVRYPRAEALKAMRGTFQREPAASNAERRVRETADV